MRKLVMVLGALVLTSAILTPASASHPTWICIELDADTRHGTSNDDIVDTQHAYVGTSDDGHPPEQGGCVVEEESDFGGTQIDFEVVGVADPDESDSPQTPDMTCTVQNGFHSCFVEVPPSSGGNQTIRAWIDLDLNDASVEADQAEGYDEESVPGDSPEPDATDVSYWTWTHGDPPPPCEDDCRHPTNVTLRYNRSDDRFHGRVTSPKSACMKRRSVELRRVRKGPDRLVSSVATGWRGWWKIPDAGVRPGTYYVTVSARALPDGALCEQGGSDRLRI